MSFFSFKAFHCFSFSFKLFTLFCLFFRDVVICSFFFHLFVHSCYFFYVATLTPEAFPWYICMFLAMLTFASVFSIISFLIHFQTYTLQNLAAFSVVFLIINVHFSSTFLLSCYDYSFLLLFWHCYFTFVSNLLASRLVVKLSVQWQKSLNLWSQSNLI